MRATQIVITNITSLTTVTVFTTIAAIDATTAVIVIAIVSVIVTVGSNVKLPISNVNRIAHPKKIKKICNWQYCSVVITLF